MDDLMDCWLSLLAETATHDSAKAEKYAKHLRNCAKEFYGEKFDAEKFDRLCDDVFHEVEEELIARGEAMQMSAEYDMSGWDRSYDSVSYNDAGEPIGYM